jgi:cellulose synthase/poly-beta-1,6-N-acetylglucosamine synthase-like glycosyltransferase
MVHRCIQIRCSASRRLQYWNRATYNEIVGFIDSDAKVESQWLKKLIKHLENPKVVVLVGQQQIETEITLGLSDGINTEVSSGLEEGEGVVLPPVSQQQSGGFFM